MTTVAESASAVVALAAGEAISITVTGEAYIDYLTGTPDAGFSSDRLEVTEEMAPITSIVKVVGPFASDATVRLRAVVDALEYLPTLEGARLLFGDVLEFSAASTPVDYTDGSPPATGEGFAGKGSRCLALDTGVWYANTGTKAQPVWTPMFTVA